MHILRVILAIATVVVSGEALRQKISLYSGSDASGDGVVLKEHYSDLKNICFDKKTNYICYSGIWALYAEPDFTVHADNKILDDSVDLCLPSTVANGFSSVRYLGAQDRNTPSMSTFEGEWVTGTEHLYTSIANSGQPYPLKSLALTGWSNWTLYTQEDYLGTGYCLESSLPTHVFTILDNSYPQTIGSVLRGCEGKFDKKIILG